MTIAPRSRKMPATTTSALLCRNARWPAPVAVSDPRGPSLIPAPPRCRLLAAGEELRLAHQRNVALFLFRHPVGVLLAFERGGVERALAHELLPLRSLLNLAQELHVVVDLVLAYAARHEDAAQHHVVDVEALLLASRDVAPGLVGDLVFVRHAL